MFLEKGVLKICCKFKELKCRSAISIKLQSSLIEIAFWHVCSPVNLLRIFRTPFPKNAPLNGFFWKFQNGLVYYAIHEKIANFFVDADNVKYILWGTFYQKQPPRGVPRKRRSENVQQIYRRNPCRSAISIKLLCNFIGIALRHGCSPVNFLHIFRTPVFKNTSGRLLLYIAEEKNEAK